MDAIKRLLTLAMLGLFLLLGAWFSWMNAGLSTVNLFGLLSVELPLGVMILVSLATGILLGLLVAQVSLSRLRLRNRKLTRRLAQRDKLPIVSGD